MKSLLFLLTVVLPFGPCFAQGQWKLTKHEGTASIFYDWKAIPGSDKTPETGNLPALLATHDFKTPLKHISF